MVYFQTKNPNLGIKRLVYSMAIWNIHITAIWFILLRFDNLVTICYSTPPPRFGILCQEKSGNPYQNFNSTSEKDSPQLPSNKDFQT
jgi:hypothetical protein